MVGFMILGFEAPPAALEKRHQVAQQNLPHVSHLRKLGTIALITDKEKPRYPTYIARQRAIPQSFEGWSL